MTDNAPATARLVFTPSGKRGDFPIGTPVLQAARRLGVDIDSLCGGNGMCGRCQITLGEGDFAKHGITSSAHHASVPNAVETRYATKRNMKADRRLSCQTLLEGDLVVDVPPDAQVHKQVVRKSADERVIAIDPTVRLHFITVREPDMHEPSSDLGRIHEALEQQWGLTGLQTDFGLMRTMQPTLRKGKWQVTAAVRDGAELVALWPGLKEQIFGLAVDLGSTTIAAHLCDLATGEVLASSGLMNPQIRFGEDVMSRVSYSMMNPGGDAEMTAAVRGALNELAVGTAEEAGIEVSDILDITLVSNPIMHHLLLGMDPVELGGAPFALATDFGTRIKARELEIGLHPGAGAYVLPCIAGHVGADTAGVALAERPDQSEQLTFIVDVGTNAEMLLGDRDRVMAASSPTGPAFEGAQISSGQRAAPGAIERVKIDPQTLEPAFRVIGSELWSNEAGFEEETASTGITGICGSGIIEALSEMFLAGLMNEDGAIDGGRQAQTHRIIPDGRTFAYVIYDASADDGPTITVTQNDVRAIQMAKAALYAGYRLLKDKLEADGDMRPVERVYLAGAFGSHIDVKHAMVLGMIPDCDLAHVASVGNAAGTGARIALLNAQARRDIEEAVRNIEKIETAVEPMFQQHFVEAMAIPHKTADFHNLSSMVSLPEKAAAEAGGDDVGGRGRRRGGGRRRRG